MNKVVPTTRAHLRAVLIERERHDKTSNTTFSSNSASGRAATAQGGAIFGTETSVIDLENVRFLSNHANGKGGAIHLELGSKVLLRVIRGGCYSWLSYRI